MVSNLFWEVSPQQLYVLILCCKNILDLPPTHAHHKPNESAYFVAGTYSRLTINIVLA